MPLHKCYRISGASFSRLKRAGWILVFLAVQLIVVPQALARYASIVIDAETGQVLYEVNADTRNYPASLTKMMTLYMAFEALQKGKLRLNDNLTVSKRAARMPASKLGLRHGQSIKVKDAILALITKSANDAAVVLAEALGGTESKFARRMTAKAKDLGMSRTSFRNASGLYNRRQMSTARDMATLGQALITHFPDYYHYFSTTSFSYNGRRFRNHNALLKKYDGTDGIKTGYIRASGYNLVASAVRDDRRLIGVVFGGKSARSRDKHMVKLLDRGFKRVAKGVKPAPTPPDRNPFRAVTIANAAEESESLAAPLGKNISEAQVTALSAKLVQQGALRHGTPAEAGETLEVGGDLSPGDAEPAAGKEDLEAEETISITRGGETIRIEPGIDVVELPPLETQAGREPATAADARAAALQSSWGVQVGAYRNFAPAQLAATQAVRQVPEILKTSKPVISQIVVGDGQLYRARLTGLTESTAREACRQLEALQQGCLVIPPEPTAGELPDAG